MNNEMTEKERILRYLEENAGYTPANISAATSIPEDRVREIIASAEEDGTILGYKALINWDKTDREYCTAIIDINVATKSGDGFEEVARKICEFPEVTSLCLMSGGYDLAATIEGRSMKEVAMFVYQKLAVIEGVTGTATHFVLNRYKDKNVVFGEPETDEREWL